MRYFTLSLSAAFVVATLAAATPGRAQQTFSSPEDAAKSLVDAAKSPEPGMLDRIFGPGGKDLLSSGDAEVDRQRIADFLALAEAGSGKTDGPQGTTALTFGSGGWAFPIPLRKEGEGWRFDLAAGKQVILDRRIGRNEIEAIGACADYVAAQREYFSQLRDGEPVQQYATRLISSPGRQNGLWWEPRDAADRSPLGDRIAHEAGDPRTLQSYKGYIYRILTRQGPSAPGGAYDYKVGGRLLAGFALIAYPETWGETGVMSFLCDQRGQVWQKNLGAGTREAAAKITSFNPGEGWEPVRP
jgi:hypothetical protein